MPCAMEGVQYVAGIISGLQAINPYSTWTGDFASITPAERRVHCRNIASRTSRGDDTCLCRSARHLHACKSRGESITNPHRLVLPWPSARFESCGGTREGEQTHCRRRVGLVPASSSYLLYPLGSDLTSRDSESPTANVARLLAHSCAPPTPSISTVRLRPRLAPSSPHQPWPTNRSNRPRRLRKTWIPRRYTSFYTVRQNELLTNMSPRSVQSALRSWADQQIQAAEAQDQRQQLRQLPHPAPRRRSPQRRNHRPRSPSPTQHKQQIHSHSSESSRTTRQNPG